MHDFDFGSIGVEQLPDAVAREVFGAIRTSVAENSEMICAVYRKHAKSVSEHAAEYIHEGTADEGPTIDFEQIGRDIVDISCAMANLEADEDGRVMLKGIDVLANLTYVISCMDIGHGFITQTNKQMEEINESIDIWKAAPEDTRLNPLVYMQQMSDFRDEMGI